MRESKGESGREQKLLVSNTVGIINQISHNPLRRGPSLRLLVDTLSGARSIDWHRHAAADCAGFGGREGEGLGGGVWRWVLVRVGREGKEGRRNLLRHQT